MTIELIDAPAPLGHQTLPQIEESKAAEDPVLQDVQDITAQQLPVCMSCYIPAQSTQGVLVREGAVSDASTERGCPLECSERTWWCCKLARVATLQCRAEK